MERESSQSDGFLSKMGASQQQKVEVAKGCGVWRGSTAGQPSLSRGTTLQCYVCLLTASGWVEDFTGPGKPMRSTHTKGSGKSGHTDGL